MATDTEEYATAVTSETDAYLAAVRDCVARLPDAVEAYGEAGFADVCEQVHDRESAADARLRELRALLGEFAPPNYTDVYLQTGDVMRLYALVDEVPDGAERFVRDLTTIGPSLPGPVREQFAAMAALIVGIVDALVDLVTRLVADMVGAGEAASLTDDVERLADIESDCDARRERAVEVAFAGRATADALVLRDLAYSLDGVADAAEDAADHVVFLQGTRC